MNMYDGINLTVAFLVFVVAPVGTVFYVVHAVRHRGWRAFGASLWHVLAGSWTVLVAAWKTIGWIMPKDDRNEPMTYREEVGVGGGIYNYRTGRFDNGMDPGGWYEEDSAKKPKY